MVVIEIMIDNWKENKNTKIQIGLFAADKMTRRYLVEKFNL